MKKFLSIIASLMIMTTVSCSEVSTVSQMSEEPQEENVKLLPYPRQYWKMSEIHILKKL